MVRLAGKSAEIESRLSELLSGQRSVNVTEVEARFIDYLLADVDNSSADPSDPDRALNIASVVFDLVVMLAKR